MSLLTTILPTLMTLMLSSPASQDSLAPYRGLPVLSIEIVDQQGETVTNLRSLIDIERGYILAKRDIQTALKRLYALDRFTRVEVLARRRSGTVALTFLVEYKRTLTQLDIIGLRSADDTDLLKILKIKPNQEIDTHTYKELEQKAVAWLKRLGFHQAKAEVSRLSFENEKNESLLMEIKEGEPLIVEEICFKGDPRVEKSFLLSELYTQRGEIWNQELMERDEKHLWELYREHNFLNAELGDTLVEINQQKAKIAFNIQAGDRVALEFEGNHIIRSRKLRELYRASSEKLDSTALSSLRRRIKRAYVELGHFHTSIKLETIRDSAQRITRHHFIIDEEKPLRVTQIRFQGAKEFEPELLERQIRAVLDQSLRNNAFFQAVTDNDLNEVWQGEGSSDKNQYAAVKADQRWIPHLYNRAIEEIENAYRMRGYSEIKVGPVIPKYFKNSNVEIRIPVVEGPQTRVEAISFRGNEAIQAYDLLSTAGDISGRESTKIAPGEPLTHMAVENARINLTRLYRDRGFLYSRLFTTVDRSTDRKRADITFHIEEGPQVRIARILIKGNTYTLESIIRARLTLEEGDIYQLSKVIAAQRAIAALGVFSSVRVKLIDEEQPAERKDVVAEVVERNRQSVQVFPGVSTADGPRIQTGYTHSNVFGSASTFAASLKLNRPIFFELYGNYADRLQERYNNYSLREQFEYQGRVGLRSPKALTLPWQPIARVDLVAERENAIPYALDAATVLFGLETTPTKNLSLALEPQISLNNLQCVDEDSQARCIHEIQSDPSRSRMDVGYSRRFKVGPTIVYDRRNNPLNPDRGYYLNAKAIWAIGDTRLSQNAEREPFSFSRFEGTATSYLPLGQSTFAISARAGFIDVRKGISVPVDERFFLGGRNTLRGYIENALIPQDVCVINTDQNETAPEGCEVIERTDSEPPISKGGNAYFLLKSEIRLRLSDDLGLGIFVDLGNLWSELPSAGNISLRVGTGIGLRYNTPVGALALDFGINPDPRSDLSEATSQIHISVGVF